jgi:hypothetical protein
MNTFWLKLAGIVLGLFVVLIVAARFLSPGGSTTPSETPTEPEPRDIYQQAREDQERFSVPSAEAPVPEPEAAPSEPEPAQADPEKTEAAAPPAAQPILIYVKALDEIDSIQAQRLLNAAIPGRSMGRMRVGFNLTVQNCRQIIRDYPDSVYAFQAKRILADIPERYRETYKLTDSLLDISAFLKRRPGTQPMQITIEN